MTRHLPILVAALTSLALAAPAQAQAGNGDAPSVADIEDIASRLDSESDAEVREAIDLLSVIDHPKVIPPLTKLLRSGQPDAITDRALEALGGLAHPDAIDVLAQFTWHRRAGARLRAYRALAAIDSDRVPPLIERGLRDTDRTVRGAAAIALGNIGAKESLDVLFQAFEVGVVEAAIAIGKLGGKSAVERFTEHLGKRPLGIMLSGYKEFLRRDDVPRKTKTAIVSRLGEVSGPMVRRFLQDYLGTFPDRVRGADKKLHEHVRRTLNRIPDEDGGGQ